MSMKDNAEKLFLEWYQARSNETGNWAFDMEEASKESFFAGFSFAYPAMKELLFDIARFLEIKVMQKDGEDRFLAIIEKDGGYKGSTGENEATAIYSLVKAIANGEEFKKVDSLTEEERSSLGLS